MPPDQAQKAMPETAIAVMSRDIHYMKESLSRVESLLAEAAKNSVTHMELTVFQQNLEKTFTEKEKDFVDYKTKQTDCNKDFEGRIRTVEKIAGTTRTELRVYIAVAGVIFTILQFVISKYF